MLTIITQEAWDSYIQNAGIDGMSQAWPMPMDMPMNNPILDGQMQQQPQSQQGANAFNSPGGIFMGEDTPGNMPM